MKGVLRQFRSKIWSRVAAESIIAEFPKRTYGTCNCRSSYTLAQDEVSAGIDSLYILVPSRAAKVLMPRITDQQLL